MAFVHDFNGFLFDIPPVEVGNTVITAQDQQNNKLPYLSQLFLRQLQCLFIQYLPGLFIQYLPACLFNTYLTSSFNIYLISSSQHLYRLATASRDLHT